MLRIARSLSYDYYLPHTASITAFTVPAAPLAIPMIVALVR
ncbi:hypothetical protein [Scytonema sp. NUACC26]